MASDGSLLFDTRIDTSGFQKDANSLGDIIKGLAIFEVIKRGIDAIGASFGNIITKGIDFNAQMEDYTVSFTTLLGDQGAAIQKVEELKNLAAKTPFSLTGLADATKTLLSFGVDLETAGVALNAIGDIAMGNSDRMSSLALAFGQVSANGRLTGQDLLQMVNAGFNPLQEMSEKTGKSMAELRDEMSEGSISADMVAEAFVNATSEGGRFYNGMQTASETLSGQWATLKDTASELAGTIMRPFTDMATSTILPSAIDMVEQLNRAFSKASVQNALQSISEAFAGLIDVIGTIISTVLPPLLEIVGAVIDSFDIWGPIVAGVWGAFKAYSILDSVTTAMQAAGAAVSVTAEAMTASTVAAGYEVTARNALTAALANETTAEIARQTAAAAGLTIDEAGNLVTAAGVTATTAETVAVVQSTGAMTAKSTIMGVLTGKIGLATAAQHLWNSAMNANPIFLIIGAVVALTGITIGLINAFNDSDPAAERLRENITNLNDDIDELNTNMEDSKAAYDDMVGGIEAEAAAAENLAKRVVDLADKENKSAGEKELLVTMVGALNESVDGLNLVYDKNTDKLNKNSDAIMSAVDSMKEQAKAFAEQQRMNELAVEAETAHGKLTEAIKTSSEAYLEYDKAMQATIASSPELQRLQAEGVTITMAEAEAQIEAGNATNEHYGKLIEFTGVQNEANATVDRARAAHEEATAALDNYALGLVETAEAETIVTDARTEALNKQQEIVTQQEAIQAEHDAKMLEMANAAGMTVKEFTDLVEEQAERYADQQQSIIDATTRKAEEIQLSEQRSAEQIIDIQRKNNETTAQYVDNYNSIWSKIPEAHKSYLSDMTVDDARFLSDIASTWETGGRELWNEYVAGIEQGTKTSNELAQSGALQLGEDVNASTAIGINNTKNETIDAMGTAMQETVDAANAAVPRMELAGQSMTNIFIAQIDNLISRAKEVMNNTMDGMLSAMNNKAEGLYNRAKQIANNIASTMAKALKVQSPSKVMIEMFGFVMDGIYQGMDRNAPMLYREAESIAGGIAAKFALRPKIDADISGSLAGMFGAPVFASTLAGAYGSEAVGGINYYTTLNQTNNSPVSLSPSEMTREGQDMLRRVKWQLV